MTRYRVVLVLGMVLARWVDPAAAGTTGLPIPRFVSVKPETANVRVGPGLDYPVKWTFVRRGLPVEVIAESGNWRRIRDWDGEDGWMLGSLLSGRRTALVAPWSGAKPVPMRARPRSEARVAAVVEPNVLVGIERCDGEWCRVKAQAVKGYIRQTRIWGAYPGEAF